MLFMLFMISGIGAWFLYDGYVMWPGEAERYVEYVEVRDELIDAGKAVDDESSSVQMAWKRHAKEAGYKSDVPKERTDKAIAEQRVIGWCMMVISAIFAAWVAWSHTRCVRAEGEIVIGVSGQEVELDAFVGMDRKKWENKGIAYGIYEENGKLKRLCLDDHKFAGCEAIILEIESRIKAREKAGA